MNRLVYFTCLLKGAYQILRQPLDVRGSDWHSASEMTFHEVKYVWLEYFAENYLFFKTMLNTKSAAYFRSRFLDLVVQEYKAEVDVTDGQNQGLSEDIFLQFLGRLSWVQWNGGLEMACLYLLMSLQSIRGFYWIGIFNTL